MAGEMHVEVRPLIATDRQLVLSAQIRTTSPVSQSDVPDLLYFKLPADVSDDVAIQGHPDDIHDAFLRALIAPAMYQGTSLWIHGNVSRILLENMERFQRVLASWLPGFQPVSLHADTELIASESSITASRDMAMLAFSGGLNATYSLYSHHYGLMGRNSRVIPDSLFVQGLSGSTTESDFRETGRRLRRISDSFASHLVSVCTNLHQFLPTAPFTLSTGLAAILSLFQSKYTMGLIGSSHAYDNPYSNEFGSTPWADPLLSSDRFEIVHDLADLSRVEKTACLDNVEALDHLRICPLRPTASNCGICPTCIEQMLCLKAVGHEDLCGFVAGLSVSNIQEIRITDRGTLIEWKKCLAYAVDHGKGSTDEFIAMRQVIDRADQSLATAPSSLLQTSQLRTSDSSRRIAS